MITNRRDFILGVGALAFATICPAQDRKAGQHKMYGLISKLAALPGQRDALISILIEGVANMPGCMSYVVAKDASDSDAIWITEVWESAESHKASLATPAVQRAISLGRPMIAAFQERTVVEPIGGVGLK